MGLDRNMWYGMVWYGMISYDMAWDGMMGLGVVGWDGIVCECMGLNAMVLHAREPS